jgi:hypothetical protein
MTNETRFIAFSTVHGASLGAGDSIETAIHHATFGSDCDRDFIEVLDCGEEGKVFWSHNTPLHKARTQPNVATVFRGAGYTQA